MATKNILAALALVLALCGSGLAAPAAQPQARVREALARARQRIAALAKTSPVLKDFPIEQPDLKDGRGEIAFAVNATEFDKAQTPQAIDPAKPFIRITAHAWKFIPGPNQPVHTERAYRIAGEDWRAFALVWSDNRELAEQIRAIFDEEMAQAADAPPASGPVRGIPPGPPATAPAAWSKPVNGLEARLFFKRVKVFNGTPMVDVFIELRNVADVANAMSVPWTKAKLDFRMTDSAGNEVKPSNGPWDGPVPPPKDLVLPFGGCLSFDLSAHGAGVPGDMAAMIDLGPSSDWALPRDGKDYFLQATLEIPRTPRDPNDGPPWQGRLELPPAQVPTKPEPLDPAKIGPLIEQLGAKMLGEPGTESERAEQQLSLIDDPRVVPFYAKAALSRYPTLKQAAIDRLSRFNSDEALEGLKQAMNTQGEDLDYCTTPKVAADIAQNIRYSVALALSRSRHPKAKQLLLSMQDDPAWPVRQTVLLSLDDSPASAAVLQKMARDPNEHIRAAATQSLRTRPATAQP